MIIDPTELLINKNLGMRWHSEPGYILSIKKIPDNENFFDTIHATAIYALVDATSGVLLQREISLDFDKYYALNCKMLLTIRKPSQASIKSSGNIFEKDIDKLTIEQIEKKVQRVRVDVKVFNENDALAADAQVTWFLGKK